MLISLGASLCATMTKSLDKKLICSYLELSGVCQKPNSRIQVGHFSCNKLLFKGLLMFLFLIIYLNIIVLWEFFLQIFRSEFIIAVAFSSSIAFRPKFK